MTDEILKIRPVLEIKRNVEDNSFQNFQNDTLRPILKLLNTNIKSMAVHHMPKLLAIQDEKEKAMYAKNYFNKNPLIMHTIFGMVIGLFTAKEFEFYLLNISEVQKRIKELTITRISTN